MQVSHWHFDTRSDQPAKSKRLSIRVPDNERCREEQGQPIELDTFCHFQSDTDILRTRLMSSAPTYLLPKVMDLYVYGFRQASVAGNTLQAH